LRENFALPEAQRRSVFGGDGATILIPPDAVFRASRALQASGRPVAAALGAVLFALHPAHPESVAFISGRTDVLSALFLFASLWAAVRFGPEIRDPLRKLLPAAILLLPGLLAKEVALFGVPVAVLALWVRDRRLSPGDLARAAVPIVAVSVLYLAVRFAVLGPNPIPAVTPVAGTVPQILTSVAVVARYLPLLFVPIRLSARHEIVEVHAPDLVFMAGLLVIAAMAAGLWMLVRRRSAWSVPLALFATTLLPVCYVRLLSGAIVAERFLFVPSGAIALAAALIPAIAVGRGAGGAGGAGGASAKGKRARADERRETSDAGAAFLFLGSAVALWLALLLWPRVSVWKNEGTLFGSMLRDSPASPHVHAIVGGWYYRQRDLERSAYHFRQAIRYAPERTGELLLNLGAAEDEMGQVDSAFVHIRALTAIRPDYGPAWYALGNLHVRVDQPDSAIAAYRTALRFMPALAQAENNMGAVYERMGRHDEALAAYRRALAALPGYREATNNLTRLSAELGLPPPSLPAPADSAR
ncbi:MAG TPA: tetratricopeptide repeat protein, partial [Acidobacteriota bacterium]|nr:tetratricopeptide repeat protein [Acidobacteriota bacterium]